VIQSLGGTAAFGVAEKEEATRQGGSTFVNLRLLRRGGRGAVRAVQLLLMLDRGRLGHGLLIVETRVGAGLSGREDEELVARVKGGRASGRENEELTRRGNLEHFDRKRL
jgi:hypothetical protein